MLRKILRDNETFINRVASLKKESPYYPSVIVREYERHHEPYNEIYISTLVRIERDGVWYVVHCLESGVETEYFNTEDILMQLQQSAYKIQHLYKLCGHEEIDKIQKSEKERLIEMLAYHRFNRGT